MMVPKFIQNLAEGQGVRVKKCVHVFAEYKPQDVYFVVGEHNDHYYRYLVYGDKSWSCRGISDNYSDMLESLFFDLESIIKANFTNL